MKSKFLVFIFIFSIPTICSANWTSYGQIVAVMPYEDGSLHVWANMTRHDPNGCGNDRYVMSENNRHLIESLSVALTALNTKKTVRFLIDDVSCTYGNPTLRAIEFRP